MRRRALLALALVPGAARAEAGLAPPPGAALPLGLALRDASGQRLTLGEATGGLPTVFAFADYDCTVLCGTALGFAAAMLPAVGLRPGTEFRLVVLGLDPADGPDRAAAMRDAWLGRDAPLAASARFLVGDTAAIAAAEAALGYRAERQGEGFAHPLALFVLRPDGRLAATLPALDTAPEEVRAALLGAAAPGLIGRALLLCQGGAGGVLRGALATAGAASFALLGGGILLLSRRERRA